MLEIGKRASKMELDNSFSLMEIFSKVSGSPEKCTVTAFIET